ncbi:MAG TPA: FtsX-like permease family protein [Desulfitobacteriaceae bacterium]|nr:FtsX-like permease family protein [Desulfitobacteriaceae bacterium]
MVVLRRKTWRDIRENIGVYLACILVIAIGLLIFTAMSVMMESLERAQQNFYREANFADGFVKLTGYPESKINSLTYVPGIRQVEGRIVKDVRLLDQNQDSNRYLRMVSQDMTNPPQINKLHLLSGRLPADSKPEIMVDPQFMAANHLALGDSVTTIIEGNQAVFYITGTAQSAEYIYVMRTAQELFPSPKDFGIAYIPLNSLKALVKEKGQVNDLVFTLSSGTDFESVKESLQSELKPYGLQSIIARKDQTSHAILDAEITQNKNMSKVLPLVFLGVAAIILYTMLKRLIEAQRGIIGTLKAFGFSNREIIGHYLFYPALIGILGGLLGGLTGIALSFPFTILYNQFFVLPNLKSQFSLKYLLIGLALSLSFSLFSGIRASLEIIRLEPAEAMRPPAPPQAGKILIERIQLFWQLLTAQAQMGIRNAFRIKVRSLFNIIGIAVVFSLMTISWSMQNMMALLTTVQLEEVQKYDLKFQLSRLSAASPVRLDLSHEAGVSAVEPLLEAPATLRNGWRKKEVVIMGLVKDSSLYNILDKNRRRVEVPANGVLLSAQLAKALQVKAGDLIEVESPLRRDTLEDKKVQLLVQGVVPQYIGSNAFMEDKNLQAFLRQGEISTSLLVKIKQSEVARITSKYRNADNVATIESISDSSKMIKELMDSYNYVTWLYAVLGGITGFALIFNSSIIILSERKRELAALRVLGMTPREVLRVITSEQWTLYVLGVLLGIPLAYAMEYGLAQALSGDLYSLPSELPPIALLGAAIGTACSVLLAQYRAYYRIKSLPYVEILATRD